jgi:hypothetical protein
MQRWSRQTSRQGTLLTIGRNLYGDSGQGGEVSAVVELRRWFPGITDDAHARSCARSIAGWQPLPQPGFSVTRLPTQAR